MFLILRRRRGPDDTQQDVRLDEEPDGPTASHAAAMISALFLLVFAIAIIVPWTVADSARQNTYAETQALVEAYWAAGDLPAADAATVRTGLRSYTRFVADDEWGVLRYGSLDPAGWARLDALRGGLGELDLTDKDDKDARDAVDAQLETVYAARRQREVDANAPLPFGVLILTVITAVLVGAFPLLSGARPRGIVWLPYLLLAVCLVVSVYFSFAINHTFSGPLGVGPDAFRTAQQELARIP